MMEKKIKPTHCVFCAKKIKFMDGTHYACFNPECVAYNTGFPEFRYLIFENILISIQERLLWMIGDYPGRQNITSFMAVKIMGTIYPFLEKLIEVDE